MPPEMAVYLSWDVILFTLRFSETGVGFSVNSSPHIKMIEPLSCLKLKCNFLKCADSTRLPICWDKGII